MAETGAESRTAIAAAEESEINAEGGGTERNKGRELVDYREAASQRDWWKKSVRIKLHKNPKLRERGSQKRYQEGFFAHCKRRNSLHMVSNTSTEKER
jgi:hypothetical protein